MKVYVVITVFQGCFDAIEVFAIDSDANVYVEKIKADYPGESDLEVVQREIEVKPTPSEQEEKFLRDSAAYVEKLEAERKSA